jgi:hypothetical protein
MTTGVDNPQVPSANSELYQPDQLIAGRFPIETDQGVVIQTGQGVLARGTVLGQITATGKYLKSVKTAVDGSQTPRGILADQVDTTAGDVNGAVYLTGEFNGNALVFDASWTLVTLKPAAAANDIFVRTALSNTPPT